MKFIHIADVHYGRAFPRSAEVAETFGRIIDYANSNEVDFILCAGDLIESDSISLSQLKSLGDEIKRFNGTFFAVSGNHDPLGRNSAYDKIDFPENFRLFPFGFSHCDIGEYRIHAFSWKTSLMTEMPAHTFEKSGKDILLIHADIAADSEYLPVSAQYLKALQMDYIALGHIHKPGFIAPNIAYCGSPEPLDSGETGSHGFVLGQLGENNKFEFVPFSKNTYIEQALEITPEFSDVTLKSKIAEILSEQSDRVRIRLNLTGRFNPTAPLDIKGAGAQYERVEIIDNTVPDYNFDMLAKENRENIIGKFIASFGDISTLSTEERMALEYGVEALLCSENQNERN